MAKPVPNTRPFDPKCACGRDGVYGLGCNLLKGIEGHWLCSVCAPEERKRGTLTDGKPHTNSVSSHPQRNG
jgi:hypothetical protein